MSAKRSIRSSLLFVSAFCDVLPSADILFLPLALYHFPLRDRLSCLRFTSKVQLSFSTSFSNDGLEMGPFKNFHAVALYLSTVSKSLRELHRHFSVGSFTIGKDTKSLWSIRSLTPSTKFSYVRFLLRSIHRHCGLLACYYDISDKQPGWGQDSWDAEKSYFIAWRPSRPTY